MTEATITKQAPRLREFFRKWLLDVEQPLAAYEQEVMADEELVVEDRADLRDQVLQVAQEIEAALDLEQIPTELRRELFTLVLQPDSPQPLDEADNKIIDRLIGHAVRNADREEMVHYTRVLASGRESANDLRLTHLVEILQAIKDAEDAPAPDAEDDAPAGGS